MNTFLLRESDIFLYREIQTLPAPEHFRPLFLFWVIADHCKYVIGNVIGWLVDGFVLETGLDEKGLDFFEGFLDLLEIVIDSPIWGFALVVSGLSHIMIASFSY